MSIRIGPSRCSECHDDYGHTRECSKNPSRRENWPVSKKLQALARSRKPEAERLNELLRLTTELAEQVEGSRYD